MEQTCNRCHETLRDEYRYCPACGLPQLVYSAENSGDNGGQPDRWEEVIRDANAVDWRAAARSILPLAIASGILCPAIALRVGLIGFLLMSAAAAWAVALYVRSQRAAWITTRAGARIGLVCGLLAGAMAFAVSGSDLYIRRYILHQGSQIDAEWQQSIGLVTQLSQRLSAWTPDPAQFQVQVAAQAQRMLTPEGHAGNVIADLAIASFLLMLFATMGGAFGARRFARTKRP